MKRIPLTQGYEALVSDEDYERVSALKWYAAVTSRNYVYACRGQNGARLYLHRYLAGREGMVVDHINGDTLDNRRENLRAVSVGVNTVNQHRPPKSNCGVRNVHRNGRGRYLAKIVRDGRQIFIGSYATADEASQAVADRIAAIASYSMREVA